MLEAFAGRGMVRVLARTRDGILLERLEPGTPLSTLVANGEDDEATVILSRTIQQMHADTVPPGMPTAADWGASFDRYLKSGDNQLRGTLVRAALREYDDLCRSQTAARLLHGDLHHDNVLFDARRGWVAIDPKGVIAELEYEVTVALRNPVGRPAVFADPSVFERRVEGLARELNVNADRVRRWTFATTVLAAIWTIEDDDDPAIREQWIALADTIPHQHP